MLLMCELVLYFTISFLFLIFVYFPGYVIPVEVSHALYFLWFSVVWLCVTLNIECVTLNIKQNELHASSNFCLLHLALDNEILIFVL